MELLGPLLGPLGLLGPVEPLGPLLGPLGEMQGGAL